jgi:uroporphyrinogen decarboxylase
LNPNAPRLSLEGRNKETENYLRAVQFQRPAWIPCNVSLMPATWQKHREALEEVVLEHPRLFPGYAEGGRDFDDLGGPTYSERCFTDAWGCTWENLAPGLVGQPVTHPLEGWDALDSYEMPDLMEVDDFGNRRDWEAVAGGLDNARQNGGLRRGGGLYHGFMWMRLYYLRGFVNLMVDIATADPRLDRLIEMLLANNQRVIDKYLELGVELMSFGDDLGNQMRLPISPEHWRKYLGPCYAQMYGACREAGAHVYMHSDGHMVPVFGDLIGCGVTIVNPQIRANGLQKIAGECKGKICVNLDLDRQLFPFATPDETDAHIRDAIEVLGSDEGGLMLSAECEPDVPLENIRAICEAFERYCF